MTGSEYYQTNDNGINGIIKDGQFIPECCLNCRWYDAGEYGDYGTIYSYPYCVIGVFFPTRQGDCKRRKALAEAGSE